MENKKLLQTLCLGAAVLSTGLPADASYQEISGDTASPIEVIDDCRNYTGNVEITGVGSYNAAIYAGPDDSSNPAGDTKVLLNGNVIIKGIPAGGYALCAGSDSNYSSSVKYIIFVNEYNEADKKVQITGDINYKVSGIIDLNLNNADSYFAGKITGELSMSSYSFVNLKLSNGAAWYVPEEYNQNNSLMAGYSGASPASVLDLRDGGVLDFYHYEPGKTNRNNAANDKRTVNIIYNGVSLNGGTFRLKSDIKNDRADTIKLFAGDWVTINNSETYHVQVAFDPGLTAAGVLEAGRDITVVDVTNLTGAANITVEGKPYTQDVDAGLNTLTLTPTITQGEAGKWNLTKLEATGGNGPAMQMAESAALATQGVLAAVRADNNDLMRRMGDLRNCNDEDGFWLRYYTGEADVNAGTSSEMKYKSMQGGYDRQYRLGNGSLFAGLTLSHTDGDIGYHNGGGESDTTMVGVYGSYLGDKGHFADFILKYGHVGSDFSAVNDVGDIYQGNTSSKVLSLSAEYGYHKELNHSWYIEPQAELTYGYVGSDDYTMSLNGRTGAHVETDSVNSLIGRLGFTLGQKTERGSVYAKLSLVREFAGDMDLRASYRGTSRTYSQSMKDTWIEYGLGFNTKLRPDLNLYGELEKSTGDVVENKWRANVGLRYVF